MQKRRKTLIYEIYQEWSRTLWKAVIRTETRFCEKVCKWDCVRVCVFQPQRAQLVSFPAGQKCLRRSIFLPITPLGFYLPRTTFTMTSASANTPAVAMAAHKDIFGRGGRCCLADTLSWGWPIPSPSAQKTFAVPDALFVKPLADGMFGLLLGLAFSLLDIIDWTSATPLCSVLCCFMPFHWFSDCGFQAVYVSPDGA